MWIQAWRSEVNPVGKPWPASRDRRLTSMRVDGVLEELSSSLEARRFGLSIRFGLARIGPVGEHGVVWSHKEVRGQLPVRVVPRKPFRTLTRGTLGIDARVGTHVAVLAAHAFLRGRALLVLREGFFDPQSGEAEDVVTGAAELRGLDETGLFGHMAIQRFRCVGALDDVVRIRENVVVSDGAGVIHSCVAVAARDALFGDVRAIRDRGVAPFSERGSDRCMAPRTESSDVSA